MLAQDYLYRGLSNYQGAINQQGITYLDRSAGTSIYSVASTITN